MVSIGPTIGIKGETAYNTALKRIIAETKNLDSQMNLLTSSFTKNDNAIERNRKKQELLSKQIESAEKVLSKMREGVDLATRKQEEAGKKLQQAQKAHENAIKKYSEESEEVKKTASALQQAQTAYDAASTSVEKMTADVNNQMAEINNLRNELKDLPNSLQIVGDTLKDVGGQIVDVGEKLTMYVTTPLITAGGAFVKWASDFTDGMAKIYTIADQSEVPMSDMRQELINLSNSTGFSLEDLAEAEYQAVSASVATADSVEFLTQATKLARAGFTSTTKSVDILSTVMNSYGKEVYDVEYISDVLLKTQNDGKIVVDQMAQGMGVIVPLAAAYHVGLEDIAAALATMTKQGVPASKSITFIRALFTELEKEGSDVNKTLDTMTGKTFAQLMDEGYNLSEVLQMLYNSVDRDSESFERLFGNVRSSQAVASLLNDDFRTLDRELQNMYGSVGQTEKALEVLETPSLKAERAIQQLKNSGMELGQTLINEMYPYFLKVIEGIKNITTWFSKLDTKTKENIVNIGLFAAAVGPVVIGIGKLTQAIGSIVSGAGSVMKVFKNYDNAILKLATGAEKISPTLGEVALSIGSSLPLILALATAFTGVAIATEGAMEKHREEIAAIWGMDDAMRESIDVAKESAEAYDQRKDAIYGEMDATSENIAVAQQLIDKYNDLIDENGEVRDGHEKLAEVYFNQLAQALGMEAEDLRELIEENGKFGESVRNTIEDIKARAEAAAYEQILSEATYRLTEAQMELEKQESALSVQQAKVKQATKETEDAYNAMIDAQKRGDPEIGRYEQAWRDAVEAESQAKASEAELEAAVNSTRQEVREAQRDADEAARHISQNAETTMEETADAIREGGDEVEQEAKKVADRVEDGFSLDGDDMGYYIVKGLADGIDKHAHLASEAAERMTRQANAAARYSLSIDSPSKVMAEVGKYFDLGFAQGITDNMKAVEQSANMLANSAIGNVYTPASEYVTSQRSINSPISVQVTVNGNADDPYRLADIVANTINVEMQRKMRLF